MEKKGEWSSYMIPPVVPSEVVNRMKFRVIYQVETARIEGWCESIDATDNGIKCINFLARDDFGITMRRVLFDNIELPHGTIFSALPELKKPPTKK
jgi:hypothetical protein